MKEYAPVIKEPREWKIMGHLALYDPESKNGDTFLFAEDMFCISPLNGNFVIDVGWYPEGDVTEGTYRGLVVVDDDWEHPSEKIESRDPRTICSFVEATMDRHIQEWRGK